MINKCEDVRNEFKIKITDNLIKEVIAFLNTSGGNIYIGVNDEGKIIGVQGNLDLLQRKIKDMIKDNIMPSTLGLFDVVIRKYNNLNYIIIIIAKGIEKPYYIKGYGMNPDSCFIRVGSSVHSMDNEVITKEFRKRLRPTLKNILSPNQNLTFNQLKIYYEEKGFEINNNFLNQLDFYTENKKYNYIAYLLSDNNKISIKYGKYDGMDSYNLIENKEYGYCSLVKATYNILNKLETENKIYTKIEYPERKEITMYDYIAVREAVINAIVHNDYTTECAPKFEIYNNKLVISSYGGLPDDFSKEEFLQGFSLPRNKELMKVFRDLDLVEQMGTGIIRILKTYNKDSFEFFPNFIRVTFLFNKNHLSNLKQNDYNLNSMQKDIINIINNDSTITQNEISNILGLSIRTIQRNIKILIDNNIIKRNGSTKKGEWLIFK